ncbi:hypothetical protein TcCL_NonESM08204 [Trypanosoma cruzi]|uniref:Uncharacterized protein n=1 Tax=Trypanosoma cruzi (strain CL Brener) TaxID=353153 RepID=Q4DV18_TRYCC|nr:uncharacterized protein Tc00.1047053506331.64 [Trypanosoma cruzi]EAN96371.1 hypothetical protein Tc00.1047053506331.64 [Trypanosoma cruzi]RNC42172.1 hypothetical protein TcCL_NonESM08204 [Trypanosoma cruzi]|eukprot:XP_818222.1 hypothetical protein Tc00.1047053506331.64 [Trypanosoma cruzi strain CL Brener]
MRPPGVPRGPSGHRECVECGIPRGHLAVLFFLFYPPLPNLNTAADPTTATGSVAYFWIFFALQRQAWCVLLGRHGGRKWASLSGKRWSRRSVLRTSQFGVFVAILADDVTGSLLLTGIEAMLHGDAHIAGGGFSCWWFVNVFSFSFAGTPQRAVSADSRALRGGAPHDFWRDEVASVTLRWLFLGLRGYPLLECIVGDHPRFCFC